MKKESRELAWAIFQALYATVNFLAGWLLILSTPVWVVALLMDREDVNNFTFNYISMPSLALLVITDLMLKWWPIKSEA